MVQHTWNFTMARRHARVWSNTGVPLQAQCGKPVAHLLATMKPPLSVDKWAATLPMAMPRQLIQQGIWCSQYGINSSRLLYSTYIKADNKLILR